MNNKKLLIGIKLILTYKNDCKIEDGRRRMQNISPKMSQKHYYAPLYMVLKNAKSILPD